MRDRPRITNVQAVASGVQWEENGAYRYVHCFDPFAAMLYARELRSLARTYDRERASV